MSRNHICDVPGCGRTRHRWQRICEHCWFTLPGALRTDIIDCHRQGRRGDWRKACRRAAEHLEAIAARRCGPGSTDIHPPPRLTAEQAFELNQRMLGER